MDLAGQSATFLTGGFGADVGEQAPTVQPQGRVLGVFAHLFQAAGVKGGIAVLQGDDAHKLRVEQQGNDRFVL